MYTLPRILAAAYIISKLKCMGSEHLRVLQLTFSLEVQRVNVKYSPFSFSRRITLVPGSSVWSLIVHSDSCIHIYIVNKPVLSLSGNF